MLTNNELDSVSQVVVRGVDLHDGDVRTLLHLESGIHEAVLGDPGIGINKQDDLSTTSSAILSTRVDLHSDIPSSPCSPFTLL